MQKFRAGSNNYPAEFRFFRDKSQNVQPEGVTGHTLRSTATPAYDTFGNFPRNALRGPNFRQADLILNKRIPLCSKLAPGGIQIETSNVGYR